MSISTGGWLTLFAGAIVLFGGLGICLRIALKKSPDPQTEEKTD